MPAAELTVDDVLSLERPGFGDDFVPQGFGELLGAALGDGGISTADDEDFLFITLGKNEAGVAHRLQGCVAETKQWLGT